MAKPAHAVQLSRHAKANRVHGRVGKRTHAVKQETRCVAIFDQRVIMDQAIHNFVFPVMMG